VKSTDYDKLRTEGMISRPHCGEDEHQRAYAHLQRRQAEGRLEPIDGWDGDLAEGYADILGLQPSVDLLESS
jgi:hypothetical protein